MGGGWGRGVEVLSQANRLPKLLQNEREKAKTVAVVQHNGTFEPDTVVLHQAQIKREASDRLQREEWAAGKLCWR